MPEIPLDVFVWMYLRLKCRDKTGHIFTNRKTRAGVKFVRKKKLPPNSQMRIEKQLVVVKSKEFWSVKWLGRT